MRRRIAIALMIAGYALFACAPAVAIPGTPPLASPNTPVVASEFVPSALPITPTYEGCAYVWASKDLPDLSRRLNTALQKISPVLTGLAYAYGENCVYGDGHHTFSAMETDFRVGAKVGSVQDEAAMGDIIFKVMQVIIALPAGELEGPQPGRVDFDFKQPDPAELFITVPIQKYRLEARDLRGAALFRLFNTAP